jgi:YhhN family
MSHSASVLPFLIAGSGLVAIFGTSGWVVPPLVGAVCKPLTTLLIALYALGRPASDPLLRRTILAALVISALGEGLMSTERTFIAGAGLFVLAQCCYLSISVRAIGVVRPGVIHAAHAALIAWAIAMWSVRPRAVFLVIATFLVALGLMSAQAESWWMRTRGTPDAAVARRAAIGGLCWLAADMTLTFSSFVRWLPATYAIVLTCYFLAQWNLSSMIDAKARAGAPGDVGDALSGRHR